MPERRIAIVIPALDESASLPALLDDLRAQRLPASEVIVVDAGSRDGSAELVRERSRDWPALRLVDAPGAAPGTARNAGIETTGCELIATVDAGSRVEPDWLERLSAPLRDGRDDLVAAGVAEADAHSSFERASGWFVLRAFKPPDRPGPLRGPFLPAGRCGYCFSRAGWRAVGGFPALATGEDKLFLARLQQHGIELTVARDAVVRWRPRRNLGELYVQYERYARGDLQANVQMRNQLVTPAIYAAGVLLAARALRGRRGSRALLGLGASAYLGLFVASASKDLGSLRDAAWAAPIRLTADAAKLHGLAAELLRPDPGTQHRS